MSFPPPFHGANLSNQMVWNSKIQDEFDCKLLDISDRRDLNNLGRFEFTNVYLALKHLFQIFVMLLKMRPDVVYLLISQNKWAVLRDSSIILLTKLFSSAKVVIHLRGAFFKHFYDNTGSLVKYFVAFTLKRVDAAIVLGKSLRFNFEEWCKHIYEVPNGTDVLLDFDIYTKWSGKNEIVITYLSNLLKSKGFLDVLMSVKEVVKRFPEKKIIFKMAGAWGLDSVSGLTAEEIEKSANAILKQYGTESNVNFLGVVTGQDKLNLLRQTDIFLLPTSYDGHPRSIIEAMAAGCPVISTPVGAIAETVLDGKTGFIIQPGDTVRLTERIIQLVGDDNLRKQLSIEARKRYEEDYTKVIFIRNMIHTFNKILLQS